MPCGSAYILVSWIPFLIWEFLFLNLYHSSLHQVDRKLTSASSSWKPKYSQLSEEINGGIFTHRRAIAERNELFLKHECVSQAYFWVIEMCTKESMLHDSTNYIGIYDGRNPGMVSHGVSESPRQGLWLDLSYVWFGLWQPSWHLGLDFYMYLPCFSKKFLRKSQIRG